MPIYSIPKKAIEEYIKLDKAEKEQEAKGNIGSYESAKAAGYINAVGDICGNTIAGLIICEADGVNIGQEMADAFDEIINP
jgi:hypothetical protein